MRTVRVSGGRTRRARLLRSMIDALALLALFEVGVRQIPPDGLTYTEKDSAGHVTFTYTTGQQDLVGRWGAYVNGEPSNGALPTCSLPAIPAPPIYRTYTFTWRGIPVESATSGPDNCHHFILSSGGLPDPFDKYFLSDPHLSHQPPDVGDPEVP